MKMTTTRMKMRILGKGSQRKETRETLKLSGPVMNHISYLFCQPILSIFRLWYDLICLYVICIYYIDDDDESYLTTSSHNLVYIPSVAKTNNFSKLSVCRRNKTARPN